MPSPAIDYYLAPASPFVYLGHARFVALARKARATVDVKPIDLGRLFPASGGLPLGKRAPQRQAYRLLEIQRWADYLGLPVHSQPAHFPLTSDICSRWILAARESGPAAALALTGAISTALWAEGRDPADPATLAALARSAGLDDRALADRAGQPHIGAMQAALTDEALDRGVFGVPAYFYRDELFWGQDRLDFLARALAQ